MTVQRMLLAYRRAYFAPGGPDVQKMDAMRKRLDAAGVPMRDRNAALWAGPVGIAAIIRRHV